MKRKLLLMLVALLAVGQNAFANDFSYTYQGMTLFYTIQGNGGVSVDRPTNYDYSYVTGDVVIPDSVENSGTWYAVTSIGDNAFSGCSGLTSVTIPNSVTSIGYSAFLGCSGLTSVTIPNSVTYIGGWAFYGCSGLTSVTIPNSVTSIGGGAFFGCSGLTSIVVETGNTHYDSRDNCNAIIQTDLNLLIRGCNSTVIPNSVTAIGDYAFYNCSGLTSVTFPNSVTSIGTWAFFGCSGLTSVTIPCSVTSIGSYAFSGCSGLTSVTIPNSVTSIGSGAFSGCSGLISAIIGDGVTNIGSWTFSNCTSLTSVTIGSSVTSIGDRAFYNCSTLTEIICRASVAPVVGYNNDLGTHAFSNLPSTIDVYIPCGSLMSYYSRWSYFSHFIEESGFSFSAQSADSLMGNVEIMTAPTCQVPQAVVNATANEGYRFDHWNDGSVVNPRSLTLTSDTALVAYFSLMTYDTVVVHDTTIVHDTTFVPVHDTTFVPVHDTTFVPVHDTTYITVHDTIYLPQYIHDTVYIHDTIYVGDNGVGDVDVLNAKVYISQGQVVVEGADGNQVTLYDAAGRMLATKWDQYSLLRFDVPASGAYLIKVGDHPARKIVVVR